MRERDNCDKVIVLLCIALVVCVCWLSYAHGEAEETGRVVKTNTYFSLAKIILPALVCRTLVTSISAFSPMRDFPFSMTIMVPSSR